MFDLRYSLKVGRSHRSLCEFLGRGLPYRAKQIHGIRCYIEGIRL